MGKGGQHGSLRNVPEADNGVANFVRLFVCSHYLTREARRELST